MDLTFGASILNHDDRSMLELKTEHAELIGTASHSSMSVAAVAQAMPWSLLHVPGGL